MARQAYDDTPDIAPAAAAPDAPAVGGVAQAGKLRLALFDTERDAAQWRRKLASAETERRRLEIELAAWTRER